MEEKEILQKLSDTIQNTDCDMNDFQRLKECFIEIENLVKEKDKEISKYKNMYKAEYDMHMHLKEVNGKLTNNELIYMKQLKEKDKEIEELKKELKKETYRPSIKEKKGMLNGI